MRVSLVVLPFVLGADLIHADPLDPDRQNQLIDVLAGYGCTINLASSSAAIDAGFSFDEVRDVALNFQAAGTAVAAGEDVVLDASVCTIRLPDIESRWQPSDPLIRQFAPFTRTEYVIGDTTYVDEGCFIENPIAAFTLLNGGDREAGFREYIAFAAAGAISGDVRFYSDSPLRTPPGLQIMTGDDCRQGGNIAAIEATHPYIEEGFGDFIRAAFATNECGDGGFSAPPDVVMGLQGVDINQDLDGQGPANTMIWLEWTFITLAAGWHEGASDTEKGMPRPPLCHSQ